MLAALLARALFMKMCTNIMLLPTGVVPWKFPRRSMRSMSVLGADMQATERDEFETVRRRSPGVARSEWRNAWKFSGSDFQRESSTQGRKQLSDTPSQLVVQPPVVGTGHAVMDWGCERAGDASGRGHCWVTAGSSVSRSSLLELRTKSHSYKAVAGEHGRPSTLCLMRISHRTHQRPWIRLYRT